MIVILSTLATYLESGQGYSGLLNVTLAISVTFYYLYLHTQNAKRDTLTGALNRRFFFLDAQKLLNSPFIILSLDLNNLKKLNDSKGHAAGDLAISTMASCVQDCIKRRGRIYRTGGDEFMVICPKMTEEEATILVEKIKVKMAKTEYRVAVGIGYYNPGKNFEHVCLEADRAMYDNKKLQKVVER